MDPRGDEDECHPRTGRREGGKNSKYNGSSFVAACPCSRLIEPPGSVEYSRARKIRVLIG